MGFCFVLFMVMWFSFIMFLYLGVKIEYFAFLFTVLYRIFTTSARRGDVLTVTIHLRYFHVRGWCSKGTGIHLHYFCARGDVSKGTGIHLRYFRARGDVSKGTGIHLRYLRARDDDLRVRVYMYATSAWGKAFYSQIFHKKSTKQTLTKITIREKNAKF